jgi:hypothetical protein
MMVDAEQLPKIEEGGGKSKSAQVTRPVRCLLGEASFDYCFVSSTTS